MKLKESGNKVIKQLEKTNRLKKQYEIKILKNNEFLNNLMSTIMVIRSLKSYKVSLLLRRFREQVIKGNGKSRNDFIRWFIGKLCGKTIGEPLYSFDVLFDIEKLLLNQINDNNQMLTSVQNICCDKECVKKTRQVFIFASVPYYDIGGGQRSAQLAKTFNNMGYRVYYIYGFESSESKREEIYVPTLRHNHIDDYDVDDLIDEVEDDAIFIFEIPYRKFKPFLDYANSNGYVTIYEHIDNWDSSLGCMFYNKEDFHDFVINSKHITVTAKILGEKIEEFGRFDYIYSANAVDSSLFEPTKSYTKPKDLVVGKKTLLYFGSLWGEWFDWSKIIYLANNCDCTINLIGDYVPIIDKIVNLPPNIHFLGLKKQVDLPAYLYYSDIALLPFKNSIIGKYVSPLKIFEYIAMNKPVLSTPLNDITGYPNVFLSDEEVAWGEYVNTEVTVKDTTVFTSENSWYARCNQILSLTANNSKEKDTVSIIVLNHNNMNVIFKCIDSLISFSGTYDAEIIVVDNDSTDGSYEVLCEKYKSRIKVIKNKKNGCSSGRNLGVKNSNGEYLFFLDSDQWVIGENYIDAALDLLKQNKNIGAVGWGAGWFEPGKVQGPISDYLPNRGIRGPIELYRKDVAYLATDGMLMSRILFEEINGFDEYYDPTCFEDTDLSLKIRDKGYELAYCPYMAIMHLPHQTTKSGSSFHKKLMKRNGNYFVEKWKKINSSLLEVYINDFK